MRPFIALLDHVPAERLGDEEARVEVDRQHLAPLLLR